MTWRIPNPQALFQQLNIAFGDLAKYLDRRQPRAYTATSGDYTPTTAWTQFTSITFDAGPKGATIVAAGSFQVAQSATGAVYVITRLLVDGVALTGAEGAVYCDVAGPFHGTISNVGLANVGPGQHVLSAQTIKSAAGGNAYIQGAAAPRVALTVTVLPL